MRSPIPEWQHAVDKQQARQKDRDQRHGRTGQAVRGRAHHGTKIGGKAEKRSRHRLGQPVTCQERRVADPSRRDNLGLKQRQDDVAAAEDQGSRPVERVEQSEPLGSCGSGQGRRYQQKCRERRECDPAAQPGDRKVQIKLPRNRRGVSPAEPEARASAKRDRRDCAKDPANRTTTATAASAIPARARSGVRVRAIPQMACATTATATSLSPCRKPSATGPGECGGACRKGQHDHGRWHRECEPRRQPTK